MSDCNDIEALVSFRTAANITDAAAAALQGAPPGGAAIPARAHL